MEQREQEQIEAIRRQQQANLERERAEALRRESELLTLMFDDLGSLDDHQRRGYLLQDLLNRTLDLYSIPIIKSFTRNDGGEQIDGAFRLDGSYILVECRWRRNKASIRDLDGLSGQVQRSGNQTLGLYLSIEGWSENVPPLLKQNRKKAVLLMDGYDLRSAISGNVDLREFILAKPEWRNVRSEPHLGASQFIKGLTH
jgi:hypothetical protein